MRSVKSTSKIVVYIEQLKNIFELLKNILFFNYFIQGTGCDPAERCQTKVRGCHVRHPILYFRTCTVSEPNSEQLPPQVPQRLSASVAGPDGGARRPAERPLYAAGRQTEGKPGEGPPNDKLLLKSCLNCMFMCLSCPAH